MKKLIKSIIFTLLCVCLIIPFAGCSKSDNSNEFGGIVTNVKEYNHKDFSIPYLKISFDAHSDIEHYALPVLIIYSTDFETYSCETLDELLQNESFLDLARSERSDIMYAHYGICDVPKYGSYYLIYSGYDDKKTDGMSNDEYKVFTDSILNNLDYSAYVGWIKF